MQYSGYNDKQLGNGCNSAASQHSHSLPQCSQPALKQHRKIPPVFMGTDIAERKERPSSLIFLQVLASFVLLSPITTDPFRISWSPCYSHLQCLVCSLPHFKPQSSAVPKHLCFEVGICPPCAARLPSGSRNKSSVYSNTSCRKFFTFSCMISGPAVATTPRLKWFRKVSGSLGAPLCVDSHALFCITLIPAALPGFLV